jgi:hypothetical protein
VWVLPMVTPLESLRPVTKFPSASWETRCWWSALMQGARNYYRQEGGSSTSPNFYSLTSGRLITHAAKELQPRIFRGGRKTLGAC